VDITTLEGLHVAHPRSLAGYDRDRDQRAAADRGLVAENAALHYRALQDLRVAADIASEPNMREYGLAPADIFGRAMNLRGADAVTGFTVMTDDVGNVFFVVDQDAPVTKIAKEKNLFGPRYYETSLQRYKGTGSGAANALNVIAGKNVNIRGYDAGGRKPGRVNLSGTEITFTSAFDLFDAIGRRGIRLDRPVVLVITNNVISWASIGAQLLSVVLAIAKPFAGMIGLGGDTFDAISTSLRRLVASGRFDIADLATVAQTIAPESVRRYIDQGASFYDNLQRGDYVAAAQELGIDVKSARQAVDGFLGGIGAGILRASPLPLEQSLAVVQNAVNVDLTNRLRAQARSGSLREAIIDQGSITRVPALQSYLVAATAPTLLGTLPNIQDIISVVINETTDAVTPDIHKAMLQASAGYPIGPDVMDPLAIRSLVERAVSEAARGAREFIMPATIPDAKRVAWAAEVARQAGIKVISSTSQHADILKWTAEWR
jgi:hypothetical protein